MAKQESPPETPTAEPQGKPLVTILYSAGRDLYRVPSMGKSCWLSVKPYPLPTTQFPTDQTYLGAAPTTDGKHWRKAYSVTWSVIVPGAQATVPADDPLVVDYDAYGK